MSAPDGIRTRVEASRGLHDWPLHHRSVIRAYLHIIYNRFYEGPENGLLAVSETVP